MTEPTAIPDRIVNAAVTVIGRQGLRASSLEDIAAEAGCGRASVYRAFPGGRDEVMYATLMASVDSIFGACECAAQCYCEDDCCCSLGEAVAAIVQSASIEISSHQALQRLLVDEPGVILDLLMFERFNFVLEKASNAAVDYLARFIGPTEAAQIGEWCARVVIENLRAQHPGFDLTDLSVCRQLVDTFLVPGIQRNSGGN